MVSALLALLSGCYAIPQPAAEPAVAEPGLSARAFGAAGNCSNPALPTSCVDDGPALQRAILAAQEQQRTLIVEAGSYLVRQPLVLPCNLQKGCGGPFRMRGEGMQQTILFCGTNMTSLLTIAPGAPTDDRNNPWNMTQDGVQISDIALHGVAGKGFPVGGATAHYGIHAAAITRSVFRNVATKFMGGPQGAGIFLGFGWCNRIEDCDLSENAGVGLVLKFAANNIDVIGNNIEHNRQGGLVADNGAQILIEGNCIEGNEGPAIVATNILDLSIRDNYYESNFYSSLDEYPLLPMEPVASASGLNYSIEVCADILLLGDNQLPRYDTVDWTTPSHRTIGAGNHNENVVIEGNFFRGAGCHSYSGVLASSVVELSVRNNRVISCGGKRYPGQLCAMILTGAESTHWNISQVRVEGNGGWATQLLPLAPPNVTAAELRRARSQSHLETFVDAAVPQLPIYRLQQQGQHSQQRTPPDAHAPSWQPLPGIPLPQLQPLPRTILGEERFSWSMQQTNPGRGSGIGGGAPALAVAGGVVATLPLTVEAQAVARQGVWFSVRALCNHSGADWHRTNLTMLIDRSGSGEWEIASSWLASDEGAVGCAPYWQDYSIAATLGFDGPTAGAGFEARFALVVEAVTPTPLMLADVAVAPLGVGWTSMR